MCKKSLLNALLLCFIPTSLFGDVVTINCPDKRAPMLFEVELAQTEEQHEKGLMFRTQLGKNQGMLFIFNPPRTISMWMKNTYIPLDMIFVNKAGKILHLAEDVAPHSLEGTLPVLDTAQVLEVSGGTIKENNITKSCSLFLTK